MMHRLRAFLTTTLATPPQTSALDLWCVAQTVYGESRGEPVEGQRAVVAVIRNRQQYHKRWKGQTLEAICRARSQFSCWNPNDTNYTKLLALTIATPGFASCLVIAIQVLSGEYPSPVFHATNYCRTDAIPTTFWARGQTPVAVIGAHSFFQNIP